MLCNMPTGMEGEYSQKEKQLWRQGGDGECTKITADTISHIH